MAAVVDVLGLDATNEFKLEMVVGWYVALMVADGASAFKDSFFIV